MEFISLSPPTQTGRKENGAIASQSLFAPAKLIHQFQDAFADFKQFLARLGNHFLRQQFLRRNGLQPRLRLVQMVERALQVGNGECAVARPAALGNAMQRAGQVLRPVV